MNFTVVWMPITQQLLADAEMAKQLEEADGPLQVIDDKGTLIGLSTPIKFPHSPYTREEVERRREEARKHPENGKTLSEIMANLKRLAGEQPWASRRIG